MIYSKGAKELLSLVSSLFLIPCTYVHVCVFFLVLSSTSIRVFEQVFTFCLLCFWKWVMCTKQRVGKWNIKANTWCTWTEFGFKCHCHSNAPLLLCLHKKKTSAHPKNVYIFLCNHTKRQRGRQLDRTRGVCGPNTVISVIFVTLTRTICASASLQNTLKKPPTLAHHQLRQCSAMARDGMGCLTSYSNTSGSCIRILITCFPPCGRTYMEMAPGKWGAEG